MATDILDTFLRFTIAKKMLYNHGNRMWHYRYRRTDCWFQARKSDHTHQNINGDVSLSVAQMKKSGVFIVLLDSSFCFGPGHAGVCVAHGACS